MISGKGGRAGVRWRANSPWRRQSRGSFGASSGGGFSIMTTDAPLPDTQHTRTQFWFALKNLKSKCSYQSPPRPMLSCSGSSFWNPPTTTIIIRTDATSRSWGANSTDVAKNCCSSMQAPLATLPKVPTGSTYYNAPSSRHPSHENTFHHHSQSSAAAE